MTVAANDDIAPYQDRHGAIIRRSQAMRRLDATVPTELLTIPPPPAFVVQESYGGPAQTALAF